MYFRVLIKYGVHQEIELLKELCEMSFETEAKQIHSAAEVESCCACDEAVYEVNDCDLFYQKG